MQRTLLLHTVPLQSEVSRPVLRTRVSSSNKALRSKFELAPPNTGLKTHVRILYDEKPSDAF